MFHQFTEGRGYYSVPAALRRLRAAESARDAVQSMEMLNDRSERMVPGRGPDLDIAFLGTVALQQAGLPLDEIFATRASLLKQCGEAYFASPSERKRRFHRTLVNLGIIDVAPIARQQY